MTHNLKEPDRRISPNAVKVWRISATIGHAIAVIIIGVVLYLQHRFDWVDWLMPILYGLGAIVIVHAIYRLFFYPIYQQRTWRYSVDESFVQLKHGSLEKTYVIVPMTKVQYVNTSQGPLMRRYGLMSVTIGTMASSHDIPALPEQEAEALCTRIAYLAQISEPDE
ncbi:PH domain-containing protein [Camelliibacillus cellulosilyticus]|uniref:PH domain-containing protein n=1 Tax=Camelliibacillus cellulosilyticus TaxID=2174486 RepID=A0ABV9GQJ9_9BACL